ncbi:hypothetical protein [Niallia taxi]|nr:hypothetical protein [Niallia taxi]
MGIRIMGMDMVIGMIGCTGGIMMIAMMEAIMIQSSTHELW